MKPRQLCAGPFPQPGHVAWFVGAVGAAEFILKRLFPLTELRQAVVEQREVCGVDVGDQRRHRVPHLLEFGVGYDQIKSYARLRSRCIIARGCPPYGDR